jgi:hypothetical protein
MDTANVIVELSDEEIFKVWCGRTILTEDPVNHKIRLIDAGAANEDDRKLALNLGKHLADVVINERPDLVGRLADGVRMAVQAAPDLLADARNEVRRNFHMIPMVEAGYVSGAIVGKVTGQNDSQTVVTDLKGARAYLLEHEELDRIPKRDQIVKIERAQSHDGKFVVTPFGPSLKPQGGLTR